MNKSSFIHGINGMLALKSSVTHGVSGTRTLKSSVTHGISGTRTLKNSVILSGARRRTLFFNSGYARAQSKDLVIFPGDLSSANRAVQGRGFNACRSQIRLPLVPKLHLRMRLSAQLPCFRFIRPSLLFPHKKFRLFRYSVKNSYSASSMLAASSLHSASNASLATGCRSTSSVNFSSA